MKTISETAPVAMGEFTSKKCSLVICLRAPNRDKADTSPLPTKTEAGELIRFVRFPELPFFVFKAESVVAGKFYWRTHDILSGGSFGLGGKTRKEALNAAWHEWDRLAAKHGGADKVAEQIARLRASWNGGLTLNQIPE